ncbi:hypothetical protein K435DRAFT_966562 [Dendrothele bispora CBS 962.96]|uniref:Uncharacterized protein n=1 Tax=Dendrothele bispora (strain CBS 962.96) TaxID=1314807 RepID=A0A4S8M017_DENBC|nr:hypothetical protein K435DRAFT_966562 [Dendrothele bispora CBS 962.96]
MSLQHHNRLKPQTSPICDNLPNAIDNHALQRDTTPQRNDTSSSTPTPQSFLSKPLATLNHTLRRMFSSSLLTSSGLSTVFRGEVDRDTCSTSRTEPSIQSKQTQVTPFGVGSQPMSRSPISSVPSTNILPPFNQPVRSSRAASRAAMLSLLRKEQQKGDDEAATTTIMTEAHHQDLLSSFSSVSFESFDLDGLSWTNSALKRQMWQFASVRRKVTAGSLRHTASEPDLLVSTSDMRYDAQGVNNQSEIAALGSPRARNDTAWDWEEDKEDKDQTIRASTSSATRSFPAGPMDYGESPMGVDTSWRMRLTAAGTDALRSSVRSLYSPSLHVLSSFSIPFATPSQLAPNSGPSQDSSRSRHSSSGISDLSDLEEDICAKSFASLFVSRSEQNDNVEQDAMSSGDDLESQTGYIGDNEWESFPSILFTDDDAELDIMKPTLDGMVIFDGDEHEFTVDADILEPEPEIETNTGRDELDTGTSTTQEKASLYTTGVANEVRRTRSNSLQVQPLVVQVWVEKESEDETVSDYTTGLVQEVRRTRSNSLAVQPPLFVTHVKQETVKLDEKSIEVRVEVEEEVEDDKAATFAAGVISEVTRSRSNSLVEVRIQREVISDSEVMPRITSPLSIGAGPSERLPHRTLSYQSTYTHSHRDTSSSPPINSVASSTSPATPTTSSIAPVRSPWVRPLSSKSRLRAKPSSGIASRSIIGGGGVNSKTRPIIADRLKPSKTRTPAADASLDLSDGEFKSKPRLETGPRQDFPKTRKRRESAPVTKMGSKDSIPTGGALLSSGEPKIRATTSLEVSPAAKTGQRQDIADSAPSTPARYVFTSSDDEESVETDLEGGAVMRRSPISPRTRKTSAPRVLGGNSPPTLGGVAVYPSFEIYRPVREEDRSSLSPHSGKVSSPQVLTNSLLASEVAIYPRFEIYSPVRDSEEEEDDDDQKATIKPRKSQGHQHDMAWIRQEDTEKSTTGRAHPELDVLHSVNVDSLTTSSRALVPSPFVKSKEELKLVTLACGLASPTALTPTPSLMGNNKHGNSNPSSSYFSLDVGAPPSVYPSPSWSSQIPVSQSPLPNRSPVSSRSVSANSNLLGIPGSSSASAVDNHTAGTISPPPQPMSPPAPPTLALVTASRSVGSNPGGSAGLRTVSSFTGSSSQLGPPVTGHQYVEPEQLPLYPYPEYSLTFSYFP